MTEFKVECQTALRLLDMAVLAGCRTLLQAFRVQTADRERACRLAAASLCTRHYAFSGPDRTSRPGTVTRHYSSDSKDDLRVRYLDGEDAGKFRQESAPLQILLRFETLIGSVRT